MPSRLDVLLDAQRQKLKGQDSGEWAEKERILLDSCHPKQRAFVEDPAKRIVALTSRGCGKTTGVRARLLRRMLTTPKAQCLFVATTRGQAEKFMWSPLKDVIQELGIDAHWHEQKLKLTLTKNGSVLWLAGADDKKEIEKFRGIPHHEVWIDEGASHPKHILEHLVFRVIGPRLGDYDGTLGIVGTPGHVLDGLFYDATRPSSEISRPYEDRHEYGPDWVGWSSHSWSLKDGAPHVEEMRNQWRAALVEKERNNWSDDNPVWLREYMGQWAADDTENVYRYRPHLEDGTLWNQWDPEVNPATGFARLPDGHEWRFVYGMDMGHSDPFALEVFAYSLTNRTLYHVYEFNKKGMHPRPIAEVLIGPDLNADNPGGTIGITGWPDGAVADTAGLGGMILDELRNVYGIHVEPAEKKNKHDAIELFNGDLIDGRIKVIKGSKLESQLMHLQWAVDNYGKLKEDRNQENDATDAAIYGRRLAHHLFADDSPPPTPQVGPELAGLSPEEMGDDGPHSDDEYDDLDDDYSDLFG